VKAQAERQKNPVAVLRMRGKLDTTIARIAP
jgi:hypothetical protein